MKKKIVIALLLCIPFVSILLVIIFRGILMPTNEEIIKDLKQIKCYETEVQYIIKNSRGQEQEDTKQYYSKDNGVRVEFGETCIKVYKKDGIKIIDNIAKNQYVVDNSMDIVHSLAFMNKILSFPIKGETVKEGQEEWGDKIYIQADIELFLDNKYLNTARIFIDKKERTPIGIIIYDKDGTDTVRIIYKDFKKVKQIDESLL
jgi:outer membrane lipoprotein-sorting protein